MATAGDTEYSKPERKDTDCTFEDINETPSVSIHQVRPNKTPRLLSHFNRNKSISILGECKALSPPAANLLPIRLKPQTLNTRSITLPKPPEFELTSRKWGPLFKVKTMGFAQNESSRSSLKTIIHQQDLSQPLYFLRGNNDKLTR